MSLERTAKGCEIVSCEQMCKLISAYVDGELSERERAEVEQHLQSCNDCLNFYNAIVALRCLLASHRMPPTPNDGISTLIQLLRRMQLMHSGSIHHRCDRVQRKMMELLDEKLGEDESVNLLFQIACCDACTAVWAQWEQYTSAMAELASVRVPLHRKAQLLERLRREAPARWRSYNWVLRRFVGGAAALCAAGLAIAALMMWHRFGQLPNARQERIAVGNYTSKIRSGAAIEKMKAPSQSKVATEVERNEMTRAIKSAPPEPTKSAVGTTAPIGVAKFATQKVIKASKNYDIKLTKVSVMGPSKAKVEFAKEGVAMGIKIHPYKTVGLPEPSGEVVRKQILIKASEVALGNEIPILETIKEGAVAKGGRPGHEEIAPKRLSKGVTEKNLPVCGIGTATGEHVDDELYEVGGIEGLLRRKLAFSAIAASSGEEDLRRHWQTLTGAAFQPRPEVGELERLRERMLGYPSIIEQSRPSDAFMGSSQNRTLYIKLFRLGVQW